MDNTALDYALIAGEAYFNKRRDENKIPIPQGATLIGSRALASGYEARAYDCGGKIVISIAVTYFPDQFPGRLDRQLKDAAVFYSDIVKSNTGKEIIFTGHSRASASGLAFKHFLQVSTHVQSSSHRIPRRVNRKRRQTRLTSAHRPGGRHHRATA